MSNIYNYKAFSVCTCISFPMSVSWTAFTEYNGPLQVKVQKEGFEAISQYSEVFFDKSIPHGVKASIKMVHVCILNFFTKKNSIPQTLR